MQILGPQSYMAAQSYCEKAFLRSLFKIPTGDLDLDQLPSDEPTEGKKKSSAAAKREGMWEQFNEELAMCLEITDGHQAMSALLALEMRYNSQMPEKWKTPMWDALERARESAGSRQLL